MGKVQYLLGSEKIFQNKVRLNLRTLCQYCRKKNTKVITGSRTHSGKGARAVHISYQCAENLSVIRIMPFLATLKELLPTVRSKRQVCRLSVGELPTLLQWIHKQIINC